MITFDLKPKEVEKKLEMSLDELIKSKKSAPKAGNGKAPKAISKAKAGATGIAAKKQAIKGRRAASSGSKQAPKVLPKKGKGGNAPKTLVATKGGRVTKVAPRSQVVKGKVGSAIAKKILSKARANKQQKTTGAPKVLVGAGARGGARKGAGAGSAPKTLLVKRNGQQGHKGGPKFTAVVQKRGQLRVQGQRPPRVNQPRGRGNLNGKGYPGNPRQQQVARGLSKVARGGVRKQRAPIQAGGGMGGGWGTMAPIYLPPTGAAALGFNSNALGGQAPYMMAGGQAPGMAQYQQELARKQAEYMKKYNMWSREMVRYQKETQGGGGGGARGGGQGGGRGSGKGRGRR